MMSIFGNKSSKNKSIDKYLSISESFKNPNHLYPSHYMLVVEAPFGTVYA